MPKPWGPYLSSFSPRLHPPKDYPTLLPLSFSCETSRLSLGALPLSSLIRRLCLHSTLPTLASPCSSLKDISTFNYITSFDLIPFTLSIILLKVFCFRVELSLHSSSLVFRDAFLNSTILLSSSTLAFSSRPVPIRTGSQNFTTVSHSSSLKSSSVISPSTSRLKSLKSSRQASSSRVPLEHGLVSLEGILFSFFCARIIDGILLVLWPADLADGLIGSGNSPAPYSVLLFKPGFLAKSNPLTPPSTFQDSHLVCSRLDIT